MAPKVTAKAVNDKAKQVEVLDAATRQTLENIRRKDARFRQVAVSFFTVLFIVGIAGIYYQNKLTAQSRNNSLAIVNYLDCIGHIPKPLAQRTQADYDKCLNDMRKAIDNK